MFPEAGEPDVSLALTTVPLIPEAEHGVCVDPRPDGGAVPVTDHADALPPGGDDVGVQPQRVDARAMSSSVV